MPKVVDRDARRQDLAQATIRVIARDGLEAATTRRVSAESGWSTGVLKYYFPNMDAVLASALEELERATRDDFAGAESAGSGFEAIEAAMAAILTDDDQSARVWIAFMGRASADPATAATWADAAAAWVGRWARLVKRGQADGSVRADLDPRAVGYELHALASGLRVAAALGRGTGPMTPLLLRSIATG